MLPYNIQKHSIWQSPLGFLYFGISACIYLMWILSTPIAPSTNLSKMTSTHFEMPIDAPDLLFTCQREYLRHDLSLAMTHFNEIQQNNHQVPISQHWQISPGSTSSNTAFPLFKMLIDAPDLLFTFQRENLRHQLSLEERIEDRKSTK
jgi:hypothetical protein